MTTQNGINNVRNGCRDFFAGRCTTGIIAWLEKVIALCDHPTTTKTDYVNGMRQEAVRVLGILNNI